MNIKSILTPAIKWVDKKSTSESGEMQFFIFMLPGKEIKNIGKILALLQKKFEFINYKQLEIQTSQKLPLKLVKGISKKGPVWICFSPDKNVSINGESLYAWSRDTAGQIIAAVKQQKINSVEIQLNKFKAQEKNIICDGVIVGAELAYYNFLQIIKESKPEEVVEIELANSLKVKSNSLAKAASIQLARHLVNSPPNLANPRTLSELVQKDLQLSKRSQVIVWDAKKCKQENMNLLLAVGGGSETTACMVHIKYRPQKTTGKMNSPIAFVGKGITFDTGGLDIKPSSGMRLMKKDMGGAAAVIALAKWADQTHFPRACDFYLALAENSIDAKAMRPSDIYQSKAGYLVEIDNTDAEGRLVLADVMTVALSQKEPPSHLIDIATLTGAIKVALGADVAGLFSNDEQLSHQIFKAGQSAGEPNWPMPLVDKYFSQLSSHFADFKNSADGFGGAITAALFLQKFASSSKIKPKWAHLDVYCWNDRPQGALQANGGSGQPVQTLIHWLEDL